MTKLLNTTIAATLALGIAAAATIQPAEAGSKGKYIALGVAAGILGTVAVSKARKRNRRAVRSSSWDQHVLRCHRAYKSYDERTDTYISHSGKVRRCRK